FGLFAEAVVDREMGVGYELVELLLERCYAVVRVAEVQQDRIGGRRLAAGASLVARRRPGEGRRGRAHYYRGGDRQRGPLAPRRDRATPTLGRRFAPATLCRVAPPFPGRLWSGNSAWATDRPAD